MERLGSRWMVFIGLALLGGGFLIFSRIDQLWQLYGIFFLMSLGAALGTWLPMMTMLNHWFVKHKTKAMGLAMEGSAVGGIVLVPLIAWAIGGVDSDQPDRFRLEGHSRRHRCGHLAPGLPDIPPCAR